MSKKTTIDASGLSCPQPVILAKKALQEFDQVIVIVDNTTAAENITRLAASMKCDVNKAENPDGKFKLTLIRTGSFDAHAGEEAITCNNTIEPAKGPGVIVINSEAMGKGNDELGVLLMKAFLHTATELDKKPDIMIFYNTGVKLTASDSPAIDDLKKLQELGVRMLICGTCVNYFNLKDKLAVGTVSNMYDIAGRIITSRKDNSAVTDKPQFMVALFRSVHHVLASEKILKNAGIQHKLIPVPKSISTDCGVCIRFMPEYRDQIEELLFKNEILEIRII